MHEQHGKGKQSYLESPERRKEFSPENLLDMIPLKETDHMLDFGAGTGFLTIPAAKRTKGTVYALDIDASMLDLINNKAGKEQLSNIVTAAWIEELRLPDASIDVVIASLVLHEIHPLGPQLQQLKRLLKTEGYLICLELEPKKSSGNAPRITSEGMERALSDAGFRITEKFLPAASLYLLVAQKED